ncbi:MAG: hypothetical protein ACOX4E_01070 [Anaerovoracaceae bacterium]|jgi:hypothetical protein
MDRYLSHLSAAAFWNTPYLDVVCGNVRSEERNSLRDRVQQSYVDRSRTTLRHAETVSSPQTYSGIPTYTYANRSSLRYSKSQITHLCQQPLPAGAIRTIEGIKVASPELAFLQLANILDIHRLILLGLQLCSHPPGKPSEAISTKLNIYKFVHKANGMYGRLKAIRACKYIADGSSSIMESIVYMILALPHALGGYGFSDPLFNYEIKLKDDSARLLGQKYCYLDLYYQEAKLAVEYDSFAFHGSPVEQGRDSLRSTALERQGIDVMSLRTIQVYDEKACSDFAHNLSGRIGKRIQIRTHRFSPMHAHLRSLLPKA